MKLSTQQKFDSAVIAVGLAVLLFLFGMLAAPQSAAATEALPPCATEDYSGTDACYWDAAQRGNHIGASFTWTGSQVVYAPK